MLDKYQFFLESVLTIIHVHIHIYTSVDLRIHANEYTKASIKHNSIQQTHLSTFTWPNTHTNQIIKFCT